MFEGTVFEPDQLMFVDSVRVSAGAYNITDHGNDDNFDPHEDARPGLFIKWVGSQMIGDHEVGYAHIPCEFEMVLDPDQIEKVLGLLIHHSLNLSHKIGRLDRE